MAASAVNLAALYSDLSRSGQSGEYDRALKIVNKILQEAPDDKQAYQCKAVCLIHLSQFQEALKILEKHASECRFERGYCLYRLNKIQESYNVLKDIPNPGPDVKELLAQVLYRLEQYEECFEAYRDLIKNSEDDYEEERETNLAAVLASLHIEKGRGLPNAPQLREHTYELCYNNACILLGQGQYVKAIEKLKAAEELCKKTLEEDDVPEEEIEAELGVIRAQLGYALQMQNKEGRAMKIYNQILKQRPSDIAVVAVASNNIVTINKDQNVFDSKKKIKNATAEGLESKLTLSQRKAIAINHCLLLLHTNQAEQCRQQIQKLIKNFKTSAADAALLRAALHCREKQVQKAVDVLKEFASTHPEQSDALSFTLVQLLLTQGHVNEACDTLRSMGDVSYKPGVISALVTLYLSLEDKETASSVLQEAIAFYRKCKPQDPALGALYQESAKIHLRNNQPKEASKLLEDLRSANPNDPKTLAQLISAYSQFDRKRAKEISKELPPLSDITEKVDVDNLESTSWTMGAKYVKKSTKTEPSPAAKQEAVNTLLQKKKKKKKKKGVLPKNYDPNVDPDPERWLPKRERSTFKKRKDKRGTAIGKGTQGAVAGSEEVSKTSPRPGGVPTPSPASAGAAVAAAAAAAQASPGVQGPRQQRPQNTQKKKKKKGGRW